MGIDNLPGAGNNFRLKGASSSFNTKLKSATVCGKKNLKPHLDAITSVVAKYEDSIKHKGGMSRLQQVAAWSKIKKISGETTSQTRRDIKKILSKLGKNTASSSNKSEQSGADKVISPEQIRKNIMESRRSSARYSEGANAGRFNCASSGAKAQGVAGDSSKVSALERKESSFASDFKKKSDTPSSPSASGGGIGSRPIGL